MVQIGLRVEEELKRDVEQVCEDVGLSLSSAIHVFLKKVAREKRIPFELTADPFYSESNMRYLAQKMTDYKAGTLNLVERELIEE